MCRRASQRIRLGQADSILLSNGTKDGCVRSDGAVSTGVIGRLSNVGIAGAGADDHR